MPCRGRRDIPGRPNNKTKAGGWTASRREGAPGLAITRGRIRGGTIETCAFVYLFHLCSIFASLL